MVEVKFCGLTRAEDAAEAAALGAAYAGVIFAGGPRELTPARARSVLDGLGRAATQRVGVLGNQGVDDALRIADAAGLDVLQLAYGADRERRLGLRAAFTGGLWAVAHVGASLAEREAELASWFADGVDAVVLDAAVPGRLGGTGVALDWSALGPAVARLRHHGRVVLAGGLRPENLRTALGYVAVDVVDVSSGVEAAPGIKDPARMRAFAAAARAHEV